MFSWLIGSTAQIRAEINRQEPALDFSKKEDKKARIDGIVTALFGQKPCWDFLGLVTSARTRKVKKILSSEIAARKVAALPLLQNGQQVERLFKPAELKTLQCLRSAGLNIELHGDWKKLKKSFLKTAVRLTSDSEEVQSFLRSGQVNDAAHRLFTAFPDLREMLPRRLAEQIKSVEDENVKRLGLERRKINALPHLEKDPSTPGFAEHERHLVAERTKRKIPLEAPASWNEFLKETYSALSGGVMSCPPKETEPLAAAILLRSLGSDYKPADFDAQLTQAVNERFFSSFQRDVVAGAKEIVIRADDTKNIPPFLKITADKSVDLNEPAFQSVLRQYAWTPMINDFGWNGAFKSVIGSPAFVFGKRGREDTAVHFAAQEDGTVKASFTDSAPLVSSQQGVEGEMGRWAVKFDYILKKENGEWTVDDLICHPMEFTSK